MRPRESTADGPMFHGEALPASLEGFEVLQRLGVGGAGVVVLARSRGGQLVAIKTIARASDLEEPGAADSLAREASVGARLRHPCIVQVRAFLEEPSFAALVYEYVPGVALARVLRLCHLHGVRLPDPTCWYIVERVATALAYAHGFRDDAGQATPIVHRDVSPSNVLLDWTGGVKMADFGIAKVLGVSPSTRVGIVKGTLGCMAPEQARGEAVDERADVYAAGLLAWRLATGRGPFAKHIRDDYELLRAMRQPRITPLGVLRPELPQALVEAVARALEPDPGRRAITAEELAAVVRANAGVATGQRELAELLQRWKPLLERSVKRAADPDTDGTHGRELHTLRYEEVALAFDDDAPDDAPTFETHALPNDPAALAALPTADLEPPSSRRPLPAVATPARAARRPRSAWTWAPLLVMAALCASAAVASLLAQP